MAATDTIAGELNSLSTATVIDFYKRRLQARRAPTRTTCRSRRSATGVWGLFACAVAVWAAELGSLIEVVNRFGSFFYGSILGVFILAVGFPRATGNGAFVGLIAGMASVAWVGDATRTSPSSGTTSSARSPWWWSGCSSAWSTAPGREGETVTSENGHDDSLVQRHDLHRRIRNRAEEPVERRPAPHHFQRDRALWPKMTCVTPSRCAKAIRPSAGRSALTRTTVAPRLSASRMFCCSASASVRLDAARLSRAASRRRRRTTSTRAGRRCARRSG